MKNIFDRNYTPIILLLYTVSLALFIAAGYFTYKFFLKNDMIALAISLIIIAAAWYLGAVAAKNSQKYDDE